MNTRDLQPASIALPKGTMHRLEHGLGLRIEALAGNLWLTMDDDLRDVLVSPGHGFTIDKDTPALISALDDARLVVLEAD